MKLLIGIKFIGTGYCGWQKQKNRVTVQEVITSASHKLFGFECDVTGSSRTDSGVHANAFCATVAKKGENRIETTIPAEKLPLAYNNILPDDVAVIFARWVDDDFHPRYGVAYKEYVYKIYDSPVRDPFAFERSWNIPHRFDDEAILLMNEAAAHFCGMHDFSAFMATGSKIEDAVRTVKYAKCVRNGDFVELYIAADGFLYNMVRIIAGTLVEVAERKLSPSDIPSIIEKKQRKLAGRTAPACGLYLNKVVYDQTK